MLFTTDDVNPEFLDFWKKYLDPVKKKYPDFKIIAFVTPKWHDKESNDVFKSTKFRIWLKNRKDWVTVAVHGFDHLTAECLAPYDEQLIMMTCGLNKLEPFLTKDKMFKPPYYKWNLNSLIAAKEAGFRWFFVQDGILDLHTFNFYPRLNIGLVDSHCNPNCDMADRIDRIKFDNFMGQIFSNQLV